MSEVHRLAQPFRPVALDLDAIEALEAALGPEVCAEVVEAGIVEVTDRLGLIERALDAEDWTRAARAARELAQGADAIGLGALAAQAEALVECCAGLDRVSAQAVGRRLLRTSEAALACCGGRPAG